MGRSGHYLFLAIGMATLFSTQLVSVDGNARVWSYIVRTTLPFGRRIDQSRLYVPFAIVFMVAGTVSTWFFERYDVTALGFLFNAALLSGVTMAMYVPLMLYMNLRHLPVSARPGAVHVFMMCVASVVYGTFAIVALWQSLVQ